MLLSDLFPVFQRLERGESFRVTPDGVEAIAPGDAEGTATLSFVTSGTTGSAKTVTWKWKEIRAFAVQSERIGHWKWASPFQPWTFAGIQVALQAWTTGGDAVSLEADWDRSRSQLKQTDALCCTPTYADLLLQSDIGWELTESGKLGRREAGRSATSDFGDQRSKVVSRPIAKGNGSRARDSGGVPNVVQVTLGGEPLRARLGERLKRGFPNAEFTVVYAASELGVILKTHRVDGWFETSGFRVPWRIADGTLEIRNWGEWKSTWDRVEVQDDLIRVIGRADEVANVGGTKVFLPLVAAAAECVAGVRRARATAYESPVAGQVVELEFSVEAGCDPETIQRSIKSRLQAELPKPAWPRVWRRVGP